MILKLLIFAIVAAFIYRLMGGKIPIIDSVQKKEEQDDFTQIEVTSECASCGTYITEADALIYQRKAYCSSECLERGRRG